MQLEGKIALVTGGGRGIGRAIALALAHEGARVVVAARSADEIAETVWLIEEQGRQAQAVQADLRDQSQIAFVVEQTVQTYGKPHILVNSAGVGLRATIDEVTEEAWETVHGSLLRATFFTTQAVVPHMIELKQGNIINISAPIEKLGMPGFSVYSSAKWGVEGMTRALAKELRRFGINVNALHPGGFADTRLARQLAPQAASSAFAPESVTDAAIYLASLAPRAMGGTTLDTHTWQPADQPAPAS